MVETTTTAPKGRTRTSKTAAPDGDRVDAEAFAKKGREAYESLFQAGAEALSGNYDKLLSFNRQRMEETMKAFQDWDGMGEAGRKTAGAWLASARIAAEGWARIADKMVGSVAASVESGVAASEKALECKDAAELVDLQSREARRLTDAWIADGSALSEMTAETAAAAAAPLAERMNETVERWMKSSA